MGTYATIMEGVFDTGKPATSLRNIMLSRDFSPVLTGFRCGVIKVTRRLLKNKAVSSVQENC